MPIKDTEINVKFSKEERLYSKKAIDKLFTEGSSFIAYPLRVVYSYENDLTTETLNLPQVMISVSKKKFKRANKRNRVKRLIRESYRLNKHLLTDVYTNNLNIAFLYLKEELPLYQDIDKAMKKAFNILSEKLGERV